MKRKIFYIAILATIAISVKAQSEENTYLNKAMASMAAGDCKTAQMYYNVYKDLSGKTLTSLESMISDCVNNSDSAQTYSVGNVIRVGNDLYTVANVTNNGKHGFAVCEMGSGPLKNEYITGRKIPTWSEFEIIAAKNSTLKLSGLYWSSEPKPGGCSTGAAYRVYGLGGSSCTYDCATISRSLLFVHRF